MSPQTAGGSRHVRTEELLPPPPMAKALMFGVAAAIAGAVAWALLLIFSGWEHGLLAWGIGGLIGFAVVKGGGHGTVLAVCAGALALLSIGTGKHLSYKHQVDVAVEDGWSQARYEEQRTDAAAWVALGDDPTEEEVEQFAKTHGFEWPGYEAFVEGMGPVLRGFAEQAPSFEEYQSEGEQVVVSAVSFVDYLRDDFHAFDILFAILGIATAFGIVSKTTMQMQVVAREVIRAEREAEAAAAAAEAAPEAEEK